MQIRHRPLKAVQRSRETTRWPRPRCARCSASAARAFYAWREREPTLREQRDAELTPLVRAIFWKHRRRYGARRIAEELADLGECCSPRHVAQILKTQGLRALQPKSFVPHTTDSRHTLGYSPNLLLEAPPPADIDQL